jgi:hypothetical protein
VSVDGGNGVIVGLSNNGGNGREWKTSDETIDGGNHGGWVERAKPFLEVVTTDKAIGI